MGSHPVGEAQKRWIDLVNDCFKKKRLGCETSKENGV